MKSIQLVSVGTSAYGDNVPVTPGLPAGVVTGDVILIFTSIRNSGTGVPIVPLGWKTLVLEGNFAVLAMVAPAVFTMPTISFTGGAANATTIARAIALRFCEPNIDLLAAGFSASLNGVLQDISVPALPMTRDGCFILRTGWKADNWTSIGVPASHFYIFESQSSLGSDAGIATVGQLQTAATDVGAATITIVGGGVAISRGVTLAISPYVTTWTDVASTDSPCDFPAEFNAASNAACAAFSALEAGIEALANPPAVRVSATSGVSAISSVIPFSTVDIDPTGIADLVADPESLSLTPMGVWMTGHAINTQYTGTEGNDATLGSSWRIVDSSIARDFNTTNNPPGGGPAACAGALRESGTYAVGRLSAYATVSGVGVPLNAVILKATEYAFRVSD